MLPILSGILFKAEGKALSLSATDLEISIRTRIEANVGQSGSIVVPARLISDILSNLEESAVELSLAKEKGQLEVLAGESKFNLKILFEEDFPKIPQVPKGGSKVASEALLKVIKNVVKAASRDEGKPILSGVFAHVKKNVIKMVATDSYRLAICEEKVSGGPEEFSDTIIPARSLRELVRVLSAGEAKDVTIALTDNQIIFVVNEVEIVSRLIEGDFPKYDQLLPQAFEKQMRINKDRLVGATRRVALLAQDSAPVVLSFANNLLVISASTQDVGEASERLDVEYPGEEIRIAFNPTYLLDGAASVDEDDVLLEVTDPLKPSLVRPAGNKSFLYLIMPVRMV